MLFENYQTFVFIILFILAFNLFKLVVKNAIFSNLFILLGNVLIILTLVGEHTLIVLGVLSLVVFLTGKALHKRKIKSLFIGVLSLVLLLFTVRNYPYVQELLSQSMFSVINGPIISVQKLGLSYILFRYVHYLVDSYRGEISRSSLLPFLNYIFFFPTILAGPIDTYTNFQYWINNNRKEKYKRSLILAGVTRIFIGAIKTVALVPLVIDYAQNYEVLLPQFSPFFAVSLSLLAYSAYIYLDFSGYCDIAIGTSYLLGIKMPENFNSPYTSINLSEFWRRWHITFSKFLNLYVFKPSLKLYNKIINPRYRMLVTILSYVTTFTICGLWHGDQINFVYWGVWHGVGLALNKMFTTYVSPSVRVKESLGYKYLSMGLTFVFVTMGWGFFHYSEVQLIEIYNLFL